VEDAGRLALSPLLSPLLLKASGAISDVQPVISLAILKLLSVVLP
jgi:hypothetical protein